MDNIVVEKDNVELTFLISDLKALILDNYKLTLSTQLINKITDNNVSLIICNLSHLPETILMPLAGNYKNAAVLRSQLSWDETIKCGIHRLITKTKITNQVEILKKNNLSSSTIAKLQEFENQVEDDDITNREGLAAKMYFRELFGADFIRFKEDLINAGLNYGYAIFRAQISSVIVSKGLTPILGIFHRGPTNCFNLSDDIIEAYRPIVDDYVYNNLTKGILLTNEDKEHLIRLCDIKIEFNGEMHTIVNSIEMYVESIMRCFKEKKLDYFIAPSLKRLKDVV